jgi:hypothetical protein
MASSCRARKEGKVLGWRERTEGPIKMSRGPIKFLPLRSSDCELAIQPTDILFMFFGGWGKERMFEKYVDITSLHGKGILKWAQQVMVAVSP